MSYYRIVATDDIKSLWKDVLRNVLSTIHRARESVECQCVSKKWHKEEQSQLIRNGETKKKWNWYEGGTLSKENEIYWWNLK